MKSWRRQSGIVQRFLAQDTYRRLLGIHRRRDSSPVPEEASGELPARVLNPGLAFGMGILRRAWLIEVDSFSCYKRVDKIDSLLLSGCA